MLQCIEIKHHGLIVAATLQPDRGLTIITGETGAGKSTILSALRLLLGVRADSKMVTPGAQKCVIEAIFNLASYHMQAFFEAYELDYSPTTCVRREVTAAGKSRAFINDTPVNLKTLQALVIQLLDMHGQGDTVQLRNAHTQLEALDAYAGNANLLQFYRTAHEAARAAELRYTELQKQQQAVEQQHTYREFLREELNAAAIFAEEDTTLSATQQVLQHATKLQEELGACLDCLENNDHSACHALGHALQHLQRVAGLKTDCQAYVVRLESCLIELRDIVTSLSQQINTITVDPARLQQVEARLSQLYQLRQRHNVSSVKELLEVQKALEATCGESEQLEAALTEAETIKKDATQKLFQAAGALTKQRRIALSGFTTALQTILPQVGLAAAELQLDLLPTATNDYGADMLDFKFSANKGVPLQPVDQAASGGEFARLMLCIKFVVAAQQQWPILVFDEIDTGISGEVAAQVARMMNQIAMHHQVIVVSHLPQLAAKGACHYHVHKEAKNATTVSHLTLLSHAQRRIVLARMMSGKQPSEVALATADELLNSVIP